MKPTQLFQRMMVMLSKYQSGRESLVIARKSWYCALGRVPGKALGCRDPRRERMGRLLNERQCRLLPLHRGGGFVFAPPHQAHECSPRGSGRQLETAKPR